MNKLFRKGLASILSIGIFVSIMCPIKAGKYNIYNDCLAASEEEVTQHITITPYKDNIGILAKTEDMFSSIKDIWHDAFYYTYGSELVDGKYMNFYLKELFFKYDTLVYVDNGRPVSMLMLIPTKLTLTDNNKKDGYYVYAVGTKNEYKGNGIATMMLEYVDEYARSHGKDFRILIPDERHPWLCDFYNNRGYEYMYYREIVITPEQLIEMAEGAPELIFQQGLNEEDLYNCRKMNFKDKAGLVEWDKPELEKIQMDYHSNYKSYDVLYFGDWQYAIIDTHINRRSNIINIKEFFIKDENKKSFMSTLSSLYPNKIFIFETPDSDEYSNLFNLGYNRKILSMINFKDVQNIKSKIKYPIYFNFGLD